MVVANPSPQDAALLGVIEKCCAQSRVPRIRTLRQFVEDEIVLPEGQYVGMKWRVRRQPYAGLLLDAIDSRQWSRFAIIGPVQSGKTLQGVVFPVVYHLFEHNETVILGAPTMEIAADKWREEILPVIRRMRFDHLLPRTGPGSRGGTGNLTSIKFRHGPTLKLMSARGSDATRSGYTARVVVMTEVDKMDTSSATSREAPPVEQMESRMLARDPADQLLYMECTVSFTEGKIFQEYTAGTASRIACPCPHCGEYVTPEREHLHGWQEAKTKVDARDMTWFACPACGEQLTGPDRVMMNRAGVLVHRGQTIDKAGTIEGDLPKTDTLGFRWSGFNNLFWSPGAIGAKEWVGAKALDEENADKELRQFWWAVPWEPDDLEITPLDAKKVRERTSRLGRGVAPPDSEYLTVGVDLGKWLAHYVVLAWRTNYASHIVDYGVFEIDSDRLGVEKATLIGLREFRDLVLAGWSKLDGQPMVPNQVWIDSAYADSKHVVYGFCRESEHERFRPTRGYGALQQRDRFYQSPTKTSMAIRFIGQGYHVSRIQKDHINLVHVNADHWKSWLHERLATPRDSPGAMTLFSAPAAEHTKFSKHLTAEKQVQRYVAGRGDIITWEAVSRNNHWLDASYLASAAGHFCGVRLLPAEDESSPAERPQTNWFARQRKRKR